MEKNLDITKLTVIANKFSLGLRHTEVPLYYIIKIASNKQFSVLFRLAGLALHCHKCMSTRSWSNCDFNSSEMLCPSGTDSCVKLYFGGRVADTYVEGFFKECGSKLLCNEYLCKVLVKDGATIDDCEVNCCDDGLCNGTQAPMVSVLLLLSLIHI